MFFKPRSTSTHPDRAFASISICWAITECEWQWCLVHVCNGTWCPLPQRPNLVTFMSSSSDTAMKMLDETALICWLLLTCVCCAPHAQAIPLLEARKPSIRVAKFASDCSSPKICLARRRNHHPFTFKPCFPRSLYSLWSLSSISGCYALRSNFTRMLPFLLSRIFYSARSQC